MKILFAASEATPFVKTGGLADVAGSLPKALRELGEDVRVILPAYPAALDEADKVEAVAHFELQGAPSGVTLLATEAPGNVPVWLLDAPGLFDRAGNPYGSGGHDYADNALRFTVFARALVELCRARLGLNWRPDILHCHDWQTGLAPALLSVEAERPATLFTIHNLAYQGTFDHATFTALGLPKSLWRYDGLEFHDRMSMIKGGIGFADFVTTVSPTYADEIRQSRLGYGMEALLRYRGDRLVGILNGIDTQVWNPATDPHLAAQFDPHNLTPRTINRHALQDAFGLPRDDKATLFGHIGRLVEQKGVDLIVDIVPRLIAQPHTQLVILGSGDVRLEAAIRELAKQFPERIGAVIDYDERLSHLLEGGCDVFLMPSRFEPCGLNQMYSQRYGAIPIVHRTGGLADTVRPVDGTSVLAGTATGFVFEYPDTKGLWWAIEQALTFRRRPGMWWEKLMQHCMQQDFSWQRSATEYQALYRKAVELRA